MANVKILLVEDDYLIRLTLAEALAEAGFAVLEAASGDEASALLQHEATIALLLTDVQLPGCLNGLQLAELARRRTPDLPVVFMTGRPDVLGPGGRTTRDAVIAKPYLPSEVCAAAHRLTEPIR
jgi:CheY-like chemotaxis protein